MMARILRPFTTLSVSKSLAWGTSALSSFYRSSHARLAAALSLGASSLAHAQLAAHTPHAPSPVIIGSAVPSLGIGGILQAVLGLIVVIGLVLACGWLARRLGFQPSRQGGLVKVVGSASLGTRERVVVVEVANTWLVLGVASGSVRRLHTMPAHHAGDVHDSHVTDVSDASQGADARFNPGVHPDVQPAVDPDVDPLSPHAQAGSPSFQAAFAQQLRARFRPRKKD